MFFSVCLQKKNYFIAFFIIGVPTLNKRRIGHWPARVEPNEVVVLAYVGEELFDCDENNSDQENVDPAREKLYFSVITEII